MIRQTIPGGSSHLAQVFLVSDGQATFIKLICNCGTWEFLGSTFEAAKEELIEHANDPHPYAE